MNQPTKADVKVLREVLKLVDLHKVDQLVIGNITIVKTRHTGEAPPPSKRRRATAESSAPVFSNEPPETFEELDREARELAKAMGGMTDGE